jgi:hypothetical protein
LPQAFELTGETRRLNRDWSGSSLVDYRGASGC